MSEIAFTGLGAVAPNGAGKEEFWQALRNGISGIGPLTRFDASGYPSRIAGEISLPLPISENILNYNNLGLTAKLITTAALMAMQDAGLSHDDFAASSSSVWVGTSTTDSGLVEQQYDQFKANGTVRPDFIASSYPHSAASKLGTELCCLGPVTTVSIGCTSGMYSIILAAEAILKGEIDVALAGGGDAPLSPFLFSGFCAAGLLTTSFNHNPQAASRPFDGARSGGVLSEGAGMLVLEKAEQAAKRGKNIYGYLAGWGGNNAYTYKVLKNAFLFSITRALTAAKLNPWEIDYICANAPSDKYIDTAEMKAIKQYFTSYACNIPISSIKSTIGNPVAAAGPLQVIASLQAVQNKYIPPTINLENPKPHYGLDYVPQIGRVARVNNVLVNANGMGGSNISAIIKS